MEPSMSPLSGSRMHTAPAKLAGSPMQHEWRGRLNATREHRKATESQLHVLLNRISLLEEAEERTSRALLRTRQKIMGAEALKSTLPPMSPMGGLMGGGGTAGDGGFRPTTSGLSASGGFLSSPIRPTTSSGTWSGTTFLSYGGAFGARPASPVRASGYALPAGSALAADERYGAALQAARALRETEALAEREAQVAEAAAFRAEKEVRLQAAQETRHAILHGNRGMHAGVRSAAEVAREAKAAAAADAEARRRYEYEARVAAEEAARQIADARMRQLAELEGRVLERLRTRPGLKLETLHAPGSPRDAAIGLAGGGSRTLGAGGSGALGAHPSVMGGSLGASHSHVRATASSSATLRSGFGGGGLSATASSAYMTPGGPGAGDIGGSAYGLMGASSRPGTRSSSVAGTRRRLAQTAGPSYAIF